MGPGDHLFLNYGEHFLINCWCYFVNCWSFFLDFWSLEVTFSEIVVSLGRLWTRLVPGGVQGADVGEIISSRGALLAPFREHFWSKMVLFLRCFFRCVFFMFLKYMFSDFGSTF